MWVDFKDRKLSNCFLVKSVANFVLLTKTYIYIIFTFISLASIIIDPKYACIHNL